MVGVHLSLHAHPYRPSPGSLWGCTLKRQRSTARVTKQWEVKAMVRAANVMSSMGAKLSRLFEAI